MTAPSCFLVSLCPPSVFLVDLRLLSTDARCEERALALVSPRIQPLAAIVGVFSNGG